MTDLEQYDLIEAYLAGTLSEAERQDFKARLRSDAQLRAQVRLHDRLQRTLGGDDLTLLQHKLQHIMHSPAPVQPLYRRWWPYWAAAASVLLLAVLWLWPGREDSLTDSIVLAQRRDLPQASELPDRNWLQDAKVRGGQEMDVIFYPGSVLQGSRLNIEEMHTDSLREDTFIVIPYPEGVLTDKDSVEAHTAPSPEDFFQAYGREDYESALAHLQGWAQRYPQAQADSASPYPYYRGITLMQLGRYAEASEALAQVQGGNFAEAAAWWRALCRLKVEGNTEAVRAALREIAEDRQPRSEAAREVLRELAGE